MSRTPENATGGKCAKTSGPPPVLVGAGRYAKENTPLWWGDRDTPCLKEQGRGWPLVFAAPSQFATCPPL